MALSTPSSISENQSDIKLSSEAQARVDATVNAALKVLELSPETGDAIGKMFDTMVSQNLRDPTKIQKIQDGLFTKHKEYIASLPEEKKAIAESSFTDFIEKFAQNLAYMNRDVNWSNELNALKKTFEEKRNSIQDTYHNLLKPTA